MVLALAVTLTLNLNPNPNLTRNLNRLHMDAASNMGSNDDESVTDELEGGG